MSRQFTTILLTCCLVFCSSPGSWAATQYVDINNPAPAAPYTSWATAATNIQDAVDAASAGDLVLVSNGVYQAGGRINYGAMTNRVVVTKALTLLSVNGPDVTTIMGYQVPGTIKGDAAVRCVYLGNGAVLSGFTLTNGATRSSGDSILEECGGGVLCGLGSVVVSNCVMAGNSAFSQGGGVYRGTLTNCTLTGNSAPSGGGAYLGTLYNCNVISNRASTGGGASGGTLTNCTLTGNSASSEGGGVYSAGLNSCTLNGNSAPSGGGASRGTLINCTLNGNSAINEGGGVFDGTLNNCTLSGNSAHLGGGAYSATLTNCILRANTAFSGGGAYFGGLNNCTVSGNSASSQAGGVYAAGLNSCTLNGNSAPSGGGASGGTLINCTLTGNSASAGGGAANLCTLRNCISYYNSAQLNANFDSSSSLNYCCTTPLPASGTNNITAEPLLASASHLRAGSPCAGAGSAGYAHGVDIDGEAWLNPPSIGCDEYKSGSVTGALTASLTLSYTNVAVGFGVNVAAATIGRTSGSSWDFGDGVVVSNQPYASHAWAAPGDYAMVLRAWNETYPGGVTATTSVHVVTQPVHYVALGGNSPVAPYSSWATAASNIQSAVDAASVTGALVLVSNGVYQTGGRVVSGAMTNRVAVTKPLTVRSVNGAGVTTILGHQVPLNITGGQAVRCVYLTNGAVLSGFKLTQGATVDSGFVDTELSGGGV